MIVLPKFKIRCSAIGQIMGGAFGKPTDKQLARLDELQKRADGEGKALTENMKAELAELIEKRDSKPSLDAGAKTYCEKWVKEQIYNRRNEFSSKYTEKGVLCEPAAIELVADIMGYGLVEKNEVHKEDEYMMGSCDLDMPKIIEEIKNSWSVFTFPLFDTQLKDKDYIYQANGYMYLWDKPRAAVNYCLIDAPEEIINSEAFRVSRKAGYEEIDMELFEEVRAKMTFADIPKHLRHKRFEFDRDDTIIAGIIERVKLCREYIKTDIVQKHPHIFETNLLTANKE